MLHLDAIKIEKTGKKVNKLIEVNITDKNGKEYFSSILEEEYLIIKLLLKIKDINLRKELNYAITDYGVEKYTEGYDDCNFNK